MGERNELNLSAFYILPLYGLNFRILGTNLINTYVSSEKKHFFILLNSDLPKLKANKHFVKNIKITEGILYQMNVPEIFHNDYDAFVKGKILDFSRQLKIIISLLSGLDKQDVRLLGIINREEAIKNIKHNWVELGFYPSIHDTPNFEDDEEIALVNKKELISSLL